MFAIYQVTKHLHGVLLIRIGMKKMKYYKLKEIKQQTKYILADHKITLGDHLRGGSMSNNFISVVKES